MKSRNQFNDIVEENSTHIQKLRSLSKQRSIQNVEFLPILTDKKSDFTTRLRQFKRGIEKIVDKFDEKVHVKNFISF